MTREFIEGEEYRGERWGGFVNLNHLIADDLAAAGYRVIDGHTKYFVDGHIEQVALVGIPGDERTYATARGATMAEAVRAAEERIRA